MAGLETSLDQMLFCPVCCECLGTPSYSIARHIAGAHPQTRLGLFCRMLLTPPTIVMVEEIELEGGDLDDD